MYYDIYGNELDDWFDDMEIDYDEENDAMFWHDRSGNEESAEFERR